LLLITDIEINFLAKDYVDRTECVPLNSW